MACPCLQCVHSGSVDPVCQKCVEANTKTDNPKKTWPYFKPKGVGE